MISKLRTRLAELGGTHCVVIDGVDRPSVVSDTRRLVRELIARVANEEIPELRLVVTGRREPREAWDNTTMQGILSEDIQPIDDQEIQHFFVVTAAHLDRKLDEATARALVRRLDHEIGADRSLEAIAAKAAELGRQLAGDSQ